MLRDKILRPHALIIGIALMFIYTWTIDLANSGVLPFQVPFGVALTVGWGFIFVSLLMTWWTLGRDAMLALFKRFFLWHVGWKWYLAALLLLPALQFISIPLTSWLVGNNADYSHPMVREVLPLSAPLPLLVVPWFIFEILTNGEEMGWRGYVLPRLQARYSALAASLILGVIWSVWHLPKFFGTGANTGLSVAWFTIFSLAASVLYTWLYNNTRGSLLLVTLFHAANNTAGVLLPISFAATGGILPNLMIALYVLAAVIVIAAAGPAQLSRSNAKQIQP